MPRLARPPLIRILDGSVRDPETDCWIWQGAVIDGYGSISIRTLEGQKRRAYAHRITYQGLRGPVPDGLELDHLCRTPRCVNPSHLEPVTHAENLRRSDSPAGVNFRKTHCKHGHPFEGDNLYIVPSRGVRMCRACGRESSKRHYYRARASSG